MSDETTTFVDMTRYDTAGLTTGLIEALAERLTIYVEDDEENTLDYSDRELECWMEEVVEQEGAPQAWKRAMNRWLIRKGAYVEVTQEQLDRTVPDSGRSEAAGAAGERRLTCG